MSEITHYTPDWSEWTNRAAAMFNERDKIIAEMEARYNALREAVVHVYNSGYLAGHHDTVEGGYVDIHSNDMDTYHAEEVAEFLNFLLGEK